METFEDYLDAMSEPEQRDKMEAILNWVQDNYPQLEKRIAWNEPMFIDHGTFIIGFSYAKKHIAVSPEVKTIKKFNKYIVETGLSHTDNIVRIKWEEPIPFELLKQFIEYNIKDKKDYTKFWR